jgi:hypothetical protein
VHGQPRSPSAPSGRRGRHGAAGKGRGHGQVGREGPGPEPTGEGCQWEGRRQVASTAGEEEGGTGPRGRDVVAATERTATVKVPRRGRTRRRGMMARRRQSSTHSLTRRGGRRAGRDLPALPGEPTSGAGESTSRPGREVGWSTDSSR